MYGPLKGIIRSIDRIYQDLPLTLLPFPALLTGCPTRAPLGLLRNLRAKGVGLHDTKIDLFIFLIF
jgi:hypothetical protein